MTTERRRAPRRRVVSIEKTGRWGNVVYSHTLSCGHKDVRKRAASSSEISCIWCLRAEERDKEIKALASPLKSNVFYDDNLADEEIKIEKTRAALAAKLGVPMEAIDISVEDSAGSLFIRSAIIYLSARDVARITDDR